MKELERCLFVITMEIFHLLVYENLNCCNIFSCNCSIYQNLKCLLLQPDDSNLEI